MATAEAHLILRNSRVLIASSNEAFRRQWIGNPQYQAVDIEEAAGGADALAKLESENWGEVLLDRRLHDLDVSEVIRMIRSRHPNLLVRLVDSDQGLDDSRGCPSAVSETDATPQDASADEANDSENAPSDEAREIDVPHPCVEPLPGMMGVGPGLEQIFRLARLVGPRQTTVLITGETGTGKELVAKGIHQISPRAKSPFVVVNCAAIPEQLLEAELFGHARGAFTGAVQSRLGRIHVAHGGTLFLDEVGELPLSMQAKLLRFLQDGEVQRLGSSDVFRVDVRVISATNVNLLRCIQEKQFRQDLYYRLAVFPLELPPLRQRREDIVPLAKHFLDVLSEQSGVLCKKLLASAAAVLRQYSWPGNVRELQHVVERAFILAGDQRHLCAAYFILPETVTPLREI
ncbi:MAG: sigma-54 dependent transcriptional regulator [Acidobacteriia bacterium]|nr:sigma-54 dependent transcriptional regulator [Terriglobia bacterium]